MAGFKGIHQQSTAELEVQTQRHKCEATVLRCFDRVVPGPVPVSSTDEVRRYYEYRTGDEGTCGPVLRRVWQAWLVHHEYSTVQHSTYGTTIVS